MGDLSEHFSSTEFVSHCDGAHAPMGISLSLIAGLERLRTLIGDKPLVIVSGYRSPRCNELVHGAPNSQHLDGRAADLKAGVATVQTAQAAGFTGIGWTWGRNGVRWATHVDVRPGRSVTFYDP